MLLTVSQKSDNSELNMTFNNKAYDFVQIKEIYHCKCPDNSSTPLFEVDKIGFPQENKVVWFNYEIDIDTISSINDNSGQCAKAKQLLQTHKQNIKIKISVIKTKDYYNCIVIDNREKYMFKSKIILKAVNAE